MTNADRLFGVLLAVAVVQAGALVWCRSGTPVVVVPLLTEVDRPESLGAPNGGAAVVRARAVAMGDYVTIEDLARGGLLSASSISPRLSASERERLAPIVVQAERHRAELLAIEDELGRAEAELDARAVLIARSFTPEQAAWVVTERSRVSVGGVEAEYWRVLADELAAP